MTDRWDDFDCALATSLSELPPPEKTVRTVTPFRTAMERIVLGLCLTCFTLHLWYLDYLLPAVGTMELYQGFRSLRKSNRWFRIGWIISACKAILLYISFVLQATPLWGRIPALPTALLVLMTVPSLALFLCLWQGLAEAAAEVDRPRKTAVPALWALVWYAVLAVLAFLWPNPGWISLLVMIYAFCRIVRSLLRAGAQLSDWGYAVRAAPVRISTQQLKRLFFGSLAVFLLLAILLSSHVPLSGDAVEQNFDSPESTAIQAELSRLDFPEELLEMLLPEDLEALSGAIACDTEGSDRLPLGSDQENLHENRVAALLYPDGSVKVVHAFSAEPEGTIWLNRISLQSNAALTDVTCRLFYQRGDENCAAALPLDQVTEDRGIDYFGQDYQTFTAYWEPFSWPLGSTDRRGYLIVTADQEANPETVLNEMLKVAARSLPIYPYDLDTLASGGNTWRYGDQFYYGDGSSLLYKADQEATS